MIIIHVRSNLLPVGDIQLIRIGKHKPERLIKATGQCFQFTPQLSVSTCYQYILLYQPIEIDLFGGLFLCSSQHLTKSCKNSHYSCYLRVSIRPVTDSAFTLQSHFANHTSQILYSTSKITSLHDPCFYTSLKASAAGP